MNKKCETCANYLRDQKAYSKGVCGHVEAKKANQSKKSTECRWYERT